MVELLLAVLMNLPLPPAPASAISLRFSGFPLRRRGFEGQDGRQAGIPSMLYNLDYPFISTGTGIPIIVRIIGAMSLSPVKLLSSPEDAYADECTNV